MRTLTLGLVATTAMTMIGWEPQRGRCDDGSRPPETSAKAAGQAFATTGQSPKQWAPLFNGRNLDGWYTFLQKHGKNSDPDHVITIENDTIHLYKSAADGSRVVMGYIGTEKEYGNYHLRLQYRWGSKKFEPRYKLNRDAGLYYHILGPDAVWPRGMQFQIEQTNVGDLLAIYGLQVDSWIDPKTKSSRMPTYLSPEQGGLPHVVRGKTLGYQRHLAGQFEVDGWNTVEVIAKDDTVIHKLNGQIINQGQNVRLIDPKAKASAKPEPITRGRIALEIEAAEIFYRDVELLHLN